MVQDSVVADRVINGSSPSGSFGVKRVLSEERKSWIGLKTAVKDWWMTVTLYTSIKAD